MVTHSDVGVRPAVPADAPAVGAVQAALWRDAFAGDLPPEVIAACTPEAFAAAWRESLAAPPTPDHVLLVAHVGGRIVGLAALGPAEDPDLDADSATEVLVLGVDPAERRTGHGSRLLAAVVDHARERGAGPLVTWVLVPHEATRAFLQGAGFAPDRARRERIVAEDGRTVLEARLRTDLARSPDGTP